MGRRNQKKTEFEEFLDVCFHIYTRSPIWVGPLVSIVVFIICRYIIPFIIPVNKEGFNLFAVVVPIIKMMAWLFAAVLLVPWITAEIWKLKNRQLLNTRTGLESIQDVSWREFERLVSEAYRRKGYTTAVVGNDTGDGGIDITLKGPGEYILVQCKQWKVYTVGVSVVREMLGVVVSEKATKGIVVTSGTFTEDAIAFANSNPQIELVDGPKLAKLIATVQAPGSNRVSDTSVATQAPLVPTCPTCSAPMTKRTARKGPKAGQVFWGCSNYPNCKDTLPI